MSRVVTGPRQVPSRSKRVGADDEWLVIVKYATKPLIEHHRFPLDAKQEATTFAGKEKRR